MDLEELSDSDLLALREKAIQAPAAAHSGSLQDLSDDDLLSLHDSISGKDNTKMVIDGTRQQTQTAGEPSELKDIGLSFATGLRSGAEMLAGTAGDARELAQGGVDFLLEKIGATDEQREIARGVVGNATLLPNAPTTSEIRSVTNPIIGEARTPETTAGEFARTAGEFAPSAAFGAGGVIRRAVGVAAPAVASEAAGQATEGTRLEPFARLAGAVAGGAAASRRPFTPNANRVAERAEAIEAFERAGVNPSIAATSTSETVKRTAKAIEDTPIIGATVQRPAQETLRQTAQASERVSSGFGSSQAADVTGRQLQNSVERYATERVSDAFTPGVSAAATDTLAASLPSRATSFKAKANALYQRLDTAVPADTPVDLSNYRSALNRAVDAFDDANLNEALRDPALAALAERFQGQVVAWTDARRLRTLVRAKFGTEGLLPNITASEKNRIISALTEDLTAAASNVGGNAPQALKRADQFYSAGLDRIKNTLGKVTKADTPEKAFDVLMKATRTPDKGGNIKLLTAARRSMRPEEWNEVSSTIIANLGKPVASAGGFVNELGFSASTFLTNYNKLAPRARHLLFKGSGQGALGRELDDLVKVAESLKSVEQFANVSRSGGVVTTGMLLLSGAASPVLTGAGAAGGATVGHLLFNPRFVRVLTNIQQDAVAAARAGRALPNNQEQATRLIALAKSNPNLRGDLAPMIEQLNGPTQ